MSCSSGLLSSLKQQQGQWVEDDERHVSSEEEDTIFDPLEHVVYNDALFLSKPDQMYECSICLNTLRDATICTLCGNSFCHKCIVDCIERLRKCSTCGCALKSTTEGIVPNRITRGVIEKFEVKCFSTQKAHQSGVGAFYGTFAVGLPPPIKVHNQGLKTHGGMPSPPPSVDNKENVDMSLLPSSLPAEMCTEMCNWTGLLRDAESHYRIHCPFALVHCTHEGCSYISARRDVHVHCQYEGCSFVSAPQDASAHLSQCPFRQGHCQWCSKGLVFHSVPAHELACEQRMVECPNGCCVETSDELGQAVFCLEARHVKEHRMVCQKEVVDCGFASAGCSVRLTRDAMSAHEQDAGVHVLLLFRELKLAQEKIKMLEAKTETLEETAEDFELKAELLDDRIGELEVNTHKTKIETAEMMVKSGEKTNALQREMKNQSDTMVALQRKMSNVSDTVVALQRAMNNVCVTMKSINQFRSDFTIGFADAVLGNHAFRIWIYWFTKNARAPEAHINCKRNERLFQFSARPNTEIKGHVIFSISIPSHPSVPTKTKKWESFIFPPDSNPATIKLYGCMGWLEATIREIITNPLFERKEHNQTNVMFKVEWHLEQC